MQAAWGLAPDSRVRHVVDLVVRHRRIRGVLDRDAHGAAVVHADVAHPVVLDAIAHAGAAHLHAAAGNVLEHVADHRVVRAHPGQDQRQPTEVSEVVALDADPLGSTDRDVSRHPAVAARVEPAADDLRKAGLPGRGQPGRVGEGQPPECHVVKRGGGCPFAHDQLLQDRGDDRYLPRILPPTGQVVENMAARPGPIQVPAARLAKQAEAVLDVRGRDGLQPRDVRVVGLLEIAEARLVDDHQAPLVVAADTGDTAAGLRVGQPALAAVEDELHVLGMLPGLRHGVAGRVAASAGRSPLRAGRGRARSAAHACRRRTAGESRACRRPHATRRRRSQPGASP